ncbi:hypothetical protein VA7868_01406 [Vibrio aerogenes CECT 7868]|uniref:Uncharacterized protein n=1 Tax=Vibrio aerogenes CECT 7868 TaxID=1216006 RepID=A0A1M5Y0B0_9VIBR|nr:hypothetical protein VA7868_01406 [Vibrio aerogenes CECT 7868]
MGCCNQPPPGGTKNLGLLLKYLGVFLAIILLIAFFFG